MTDYVCPQCGAVKLEDCKLDMLEELRNAGKIVDMKAGTVTLHIRTCVRRIVATINFKE